jgi:hypothetical protein
MRGRGTVHLLITDITPADAVLDHAIPWTDDLDDALALRPDDGDAPDSEEPLPAGARHHWYEPRLSALRRLIAEQQIWEIR